MKYLSICSGIEAATVAWEPLGWEAVGFSEIEPFPRAVLQHHYPHVPLHGDFTELIKNPPSCDVLVGGTPCQAFSVAGARRSLADARGNLTLAYIMLADAIDRRNREEGKEPCIIVWENVPGVFSTADNAFGAFLGGLSGEDGPLEPPRGKWSNAGLVSGPARTVCWRVLDAQYFGVAQRRRRCFLVSSARDGFDPWQVLFEWEGVRRDSAPRREARQEAPATARGRAAKRSRARVTGIAPDVSGPLGGAGQSGGFRTTDLDNNGAYIVEPVEPVEVYLGNAEGGAPGVPFLTASNLGKTVNNQTPLVGFSPALADPITTREWKTYTHEGKNNFRMRNVVAQPFVFDSTQITHPENRCQPQPGDPSHPLAAAGHPPTLVAPTLVRRLTPRECERLQGFPDDWTLIPWKGKPAELCPDSPRYKALGNSMAVPCMAWIGRRISWHLSELP